MSVFLASELCVFRVVFSFSWLTRKLDVFLTVFVSLYLMVRENQS